MSAMSWPSRVENQRLPRTLRCEHIIANRSSPGRSIMPPMSTSTPPRARESMASSMRLGRRAGSDGVDDDVDALAVGALPDPVGQVRGAGGQHVDAVGGDRLDVVEQVGVAAGAEDAGDAQAERDEAGAEAEGAGDAVDEHGAAGAGAGLAQGGEAGAEVAEPGALLEGHGVGQPTRFRSGAVRYSARPP